MIYLRGATEGGVTWVVGNFRLWIFEKLAFFEIPKMGRSKGLLTLFKVFEAISPTL